MTLIVKSYQYSQDMNYFLRYISDKIVMGCKTYKSENTLSQREQGLKIFFDTLRYHSMTKKVSRYLKGGISMILIGCLHLLSLYVRESL